MLASGLGLFVRVGRRERHGAYTRETAARVTAPPHDRHGVYTLVKNAQVGNMWWDVAFWTGKGGKSGAAARAAQLPPHLAVRGDASRDDDASETRLRLARPADGALDALDEVLDGDPLEGGGDVGPPLRAPRACWRGGAIGGSCPGAARG